MIRRKIRGIEDFISAYPLPIVIVMLPVCIGLLFYFPNVGFFAELLLASISGYFLTSALLKLVSPIKVIGGVIGLIIGFLVESLIV